MGRLGMQYRKIRSTRGIGCFVVIEYGSASFDMGRVNDLVPIQRVIIAFSRLLLMSVQVKSTFIV
jgi:hypothetical protein